MAAKAELESDIQYIRTPKAQLSRFDTGQGCGIPTTSVSFNDAALPSQLNSVNRSHSHLQSIMHLCQPKAQETRASPTSL